MATTDQAPYHWMETSIRVTTAANIRSRQGDQLADLLSITEDVGGKVRHATNDVAIWLGNQGEPASAVIVCDRLIAALTEIRARNARMSDAPSDTPLGIEDDVAGEVVASGHQWCPDREAPSRHAVRKAVAS